MTGPQPYNQQPYQPQQYPTQGWQPQYQPPPPAKRKVRVFTWIIVAINALFAAWVVFAIADAANRYGTECGSLDQKTCEAAQGIGSTIGVGLLVFVWMAFTVILGIIWLVTRKR